MENRVLVSTRKGLFEFQRDGNSLTQVALHFLGDNCTLAFVDSRDGCMYAAIDHGHFGVKLHRSDDSGTSWQEIAVPAYPPKTKSDTEVMQPAEGDPPDWSLALIWSIEVADPNCAGTLWCGTLPGGLFYSKDKGVSWELNRPLWDDPKRGEWFGGGIGSPGLHSICVDPRNCNHVVVAISCGGIWHTFDGGNSWTLSAQGMRAEYMPVERETDENIQDPHLLVQCKNHPDRMWVQHHNGIFRSDDAGMTWSEIHKAGPSTFGFAVASHPHQPDTAWFIPSVSDEQRIPHEGSFVVTRTDDAGATFSVLRDGLPSPAWDMVLRHAFAIDEQGTFLVMGSSTGGLFVSSDGGSTWCCESAHLPQVYAVSIG